MITVNPVYIMLIVILVIAGAGMIRIQHSQINYLRSRWREESEGHIRTKFDHGISKIVDGKRKHELVELLEYTSKIVDDAILFEFAPTSGDWVQRLSENNIMIKNAVARNKN